MIKKLYRLLFILSTMVFILLSFIYIPFHDFDSLELKENISYLTSDKIGGRLPGSKENDIVANEISKKLNELGLIPLSKTYKEGFQLTVPYKVDTKGTLFIEENSRPKIEFTYGTDFKEDFLNFKENEITLSKDDNFKVHKNAITFKKDENVFLFYISEDETFQFRSSFVHNSKIAFSVALNKATYNSILKSIQNNGTLYCKLPYSTKLTEVFNVAGKIEGTDSSKSPLILSAHFDHLGTDCLNNIYCGALDNASGACFLLELAKVFSSINLKPERDIIFVFLNAEEFGLLGSEEFAKTHSNIIKNSQVINIDMIGSPSEGLSIVRSEHLKAIPSENLNSLEEYNKKPLSIRYEDSSDHVSFSKYNADSLTVTNDDTSKIHTPNDKAEYISTTSLDEGFKLLNKKIITYCYPSYKRLLLNNGFYLLSFSICLSYIFYKNILSINNKKLNF